MNLRAGSKISLRRNVLLSQYTTMQVGGPAELFAEPANEQELAAVLDYVRQEKVPFMVLGKGSNMVFPDEGFPGLVITLLQFQKERMVFDVEKCTVRASGGVFLYRFVLACRDKGLGGMEFLSNIPGTIGGAVVMNAGFSRFAAQKSEIGDLADEVTLMTYEGEKKVFAKKDLKFTYRRSNLPEGIVTEARLRLWRRPKDVIDQEIRACFQYRNTKQDMRYPSSGSVFKNPPAPAPSAGVLIQELGLKGTRIGGIMVSEKHGNYFVNVGQGKCSELVQLIALIQEKVFNAKGIWLEPEVRIVPKP